MTTEQLQEFAKQNGLVFLGQSIRTKDTEVYIASTSRTGNKITSIVVGIYASNTQRKLLQTFCLLHDVPCS